MVQIKVNKWNSLVQQVEENRQNILTLSEQPPQFDAKGEWNSTTVYAQNDMINHNGSSYFSLQDSNANHTPGATESAAWWQLLAAQGETGAQGAKGETGPTGPEGDPGPGVYSARIVDSTLQVYSPFVNAPAQGDLIIVDADETTDANIGNMYIVTNPTGTSHIPLTNVQLTGNIRGPKGDTGATGPQGPQGPTGPQGPAGSGNNVYAHYISFNMNNGGIYNFACMLITDSNTPFTFETFEMYIASNYPGKNFPCSAMTNTDKFCGFYAFQTAASAIRVFSGSGNSMPPDEFTVDALCVVEFNDQVMP